jgi:hypothetical protein
MRFRVWLTQHLSAPATAESAARAEDRQARISRSRCVTDRAFGLLCTGEREGGGR